MFIKHSLKKFNEAHPMRSKNIIKESYTIIHGHYRHDSYNSIKFNEFERKQIIKRENEIFNSLLRNVIPY